MNINAKSEKRQTNQYKAANVLLCVILVLLLIFCITVICQVLSQGYISIFGFSMFRVATGSMEPALPVGTLLITSDTEIDRISVGDIVTFRSKQTGMLGMAITHRVVGIHNDLNGNVILETKGDANQYADGYFVDQTNLIGRVVYATGEGNMFAVIIQFLSSPAGFLACIVLPCLIGGILLMREAVGSLKREIDTINKELEEAEDTSAQEKLKLQMDQQTYQALRDQLRNELLEELKQGAAEVNNQEQSGAQQQ